MIRAASLRGFAPLVRELGGDPDELLRRHGISAEALSTDDGLVSITAHDRMLDAAAVELDCPDLGLRLADSQDLSILGPLALAIEASSTVAEALECASQFLFVHSPALSVAVEPDPRGQAGVVALTYRKDLRESPYSPQAMELGIGLFHRVALALVNGSFGLRSVELSHPPISPLSRYAEFFGGEVHFSCPAGALRVDRRMLDERFHSADDTVRKVALDYLQRRHPEPEHTLANQVHLALAESVGTTEPAIGNVARVLAMTTRTLQRRLAAEGTSYGQILDDVRRTAAHRFITTTDLPFGQVALLVGFTEASALTRAVRRWHGASPRELRRRESGA